MDPRRFLRNKVGRYPEVAGILILALVVALVVMIIIVIARGAKLKKQNMYGNKNNYNKWYTKARFQPLTTIIAGGAANNSSAGLAGGWFPGATDGCRLSPDPTAVAEARALKEIGAVRADTDAEAQLQSYAQGL